ncbi:MAG: T9SS type A sorting domain-containing protein, partial [Ginsengibacter sp.]
SSVSLSGTGTDADGTVSSYLWTKISGPTATITSATSAATTVTTLVQGTYLFELKVTDNQGAIGRDTMKVTVNAAANIPPVSNAGADKTITLPTSSVSLSGTGTDADGTVSSYLWTKVSGPTATITSATSAATTVTALVQGTYLFELKVTDNQGAIGRDTIKVTVNAAGNIPPVANAGTDKTITLPTNTVSLSGTGTDADGTVSSYLWTKVSGPAATITSATSAATTVTSLVQGTYLFELKVTDNNGAVGRDTLKVTVNAAVNIPPVSHAGPDRIITLPTNIANLKGAGTDADGTVVSYLWTKISGPASYNIVNKVSPVTDVSGLTGGVYLFELKVTDNGGSNAKDTMKVTVKSVTNAAPMANAGGDQTITLPKDSTVLRGDGMDADGVIKNVSWTQISGPSNSTISVADSADTKVTNLVGGTYEFAFSVTDNSGAEATDTVKVVVAVPRLASPINRVKVYPNPVYDMATLEITTQKSNVPLMVVITDMQGKIVYQNRLYTTQSITTSKINMSRFIKGIYAVTVYFSEKEKQTIKIFRSN